MNVCDLRNGDWRCRFLEIFMGSDDDEVFQVCVNCLLLESTRLLLIHGYIYSYSSAHVQHQSAATFKILIKSSVPFLYFAFTAVPCSKYALRRWGSLLRNSITAPSALSPHETTNSTTFFNNEHPIRHARLNECH